MTRRTGNNYSGARWTHSRRRSPDRRSPTHRGTYAIQFVTTRDDGKRFVTDTLRGELSDVVRLTADRSEDCSVIHRDRGDLVCARRGGVWTARDGSLVREIGGVEVYAAG